MTERAFSAADRRSGCCPAAGVEGAGKTARPAVISTGVFRLFFSIRRRDACGDGRRFAYETFGGRERSADRRRVKACQQRQDANWRLF